MSTGNDRLGNDQSETLMDAQEYMALLEHLEGELTAWPSADCTHLLGILERIRVSAWANIVGSSRESTRHDRSQLLTLPQVAERLTIPETYAYELARRGTLPVVRLGKYVRVSLAELETWVEKQTSLERRIDREPPDFHSALARKKRPGHVPIGISASRGRPRGQKDAHASKSTQRSQVGFRPGVPDPGSQAEPGSGEQKASHHEG
jgi:excisionase family DNA binding protein